MVLLGLDDVATEHLWVLDFDLRVVEDVIVVVDVLNDFDRLLVVLTLLLRLRRAASASTMRSREASLVHLAAMVLRKVVHVWSRVVEVLVASVSLIASQVALSGARGVATRA